MSDQNAEQEGRHASYEEMEVAINDADSPSAFEIIIDALRGLPGMRAVHASRGGLMISFNPVAIDQGQICTEIERAGFTIDGVEAGQPAIHISGPKPTGEPLSRMSIPPKTHDDPGGHKGQ